MNGPPTVSSLRYRGRVQVLNWLAGVAERLGSDLGRLDPDAILAHARRSTGLDDFGDPRFDAPLRRVVELVRQETSFTPLARVILRQSWNLAAVHRLQLAEHLKRHPEIRDIEIKKPIFVLGFPRTGTTLLQNLLALDPRRRGLRLWELTDPIPAAADPLAHERSAVRRISWALAGAYQLAPEMGQVHYIAPTTYEECWYLFGNTFSVMNWDLQSGLQAYGDWLTDDYDMRPAYHEYRSYLQTRLRWGPAEQLVLKCPEHLWFLEALLSVFPDACIVWTHRDPFPTIASYCSLMSMQWRNLYGEIPMRRLGEHMERRLLQGVDRAMAARERLGSDRFIDVRFNDLVEDPIGQLRKIHERFDLGWADADAARAREYLATDREDARGQHRYDPAAYDLDRDAIHARYRHYIDAYRLGGAG
jgi:hypothetical protein